jgi:hypothetical protein
MRAPRRRAEQGTTRGACARQLTGGGLVQIWQWVIHAQRTHQRQGHRGQFGQEDHTFIHTHCNHVAFAPARACMCVMC